MRQYLLLLTAVACGLAYPAATIGEIADQHRLPDNLKLEQFWQSGPYCGPNSLYCTLRLCGLLVSYEAVLHRLTPGDAGSSLEELRATASELGLQMNLIKIDPAEFDKLATPFVAHLDFVHMRKGGATGHFVTVVSIKGDDIKIIDGTSSKFMTVKKERLLRDWSGAVLIPSRPVRTTVLDLSASLAIIYLCLYIIYLLCSFGGGHWTDMRSLLQSAVYPIGLGLTAASVAVAFAPAHRATGQKAGMQQGANQVRTTPLRIRPPESTHPLRNLDMRKLGSVFALLEPRWRRIKTNHLLHALRLWGPNATFDRDPFPNLHRSTTLSSERMLAMLLDNDAYIAAKAEPIPFLYRSSAGIGVLVSSDGGGVAHRDQFIKAMADCGVSADTIVRLPDGDTGALRDIIEDALRMFDPTQEAEFTAIALSQWLPPTTKWYDKFGNIHTFDKLVARLLDTHYMGDKPSCLGGHVPYALACILRADERYRIISDTTRSSIIGRLKAISEVLERNVSPTGVWFYDWDKSPIPRTGSDAPAEAFQAVLATGHHLEWIAIAPVECRPSAQRVASAAERLLDLIILHNTYTVSNEYAAFSHAARALSLLAGVEPAVTVREFGPK